MKPFDPNRLATLHDKHIGDVRAAVRQLREKGYISQAVADALKVPLNTAKSWMRGTTVPSSTRVREAFLRFAREAPVHVRPEKPPTTVVVWPDTVSRPKLETHRSSTEAIALIRREGFVPEEIFDEKTIKDYSGILGLPTSVKHVLLARQRK